MQLIRSLIPDRLPPLVKEVKTGEHSNKHHVIIQTEHSSGKLGCTISQLRFIKVLDRLVFSAMQFSFIYFFNVL